MWKYRQICRPTFAARRCSASRDALNDATGASRAWSRARQWRYAPETTFEVPHFRPSIGGEMQCLARFGLAVRVCR
jgi:hypothetical protein